MTALSSYGIPFSITHDGRYQFDSDQTLVYKKMYLNNVTNYDMSFHRYEFQNCGIIHNHMLIDLTQVNHVEEEVNTNAQDIEWKNYVSPIFGKSIVLNMFC